MRSFKKDGQRILVTNPDQEHAAIANQTGAVMRRLRRAPYVAWVRVDCELPEHLCSFPAGDSRHNHILLDAGECSLEPNTAPAERKAA